MQASVDLSSHLKTTPTVDLWAIADEFRDWVCSELRNLTTTQRASFRGDYVFIIDEHPRFIVMVDEGSAWSVTLTDAKKQQFTLEKGCPLVLSWQAIEDCLAYFAKATVTTESQTLQKLLLGTMKAKIAFLTSKVTVAGDLASFLKMVTLLKQKGVKPLASNVNGG